MPRTWFDDDDQITELNSLDELRAPPPVQNLDEDESRRQDGYLEDIPSRSYTGRSSSSQRPPGKPGHKHQRSLSIGIPSIHNQQQALDEVSAPPPARRRSQAAEYVNLDDDDTGEPKQHRPRRFANDLVSHLVIVSYLIFFSFFGTLARLGVQWLTFYPGAPVVTSVLWANVGGSFFMGFLSEDRRLFQHPSFDGNGNGDKPTRSDSELRAHHVKVKKTIPLYIGLATGFCGSFTSFSSFMRDAFLALSNDLPAPYAHPIPAGQNPPGFTSTYHRHNGYSVMALLAVLIYEPALSLASLFVGAHAALLLDRITPSIPYSITRHVLDPVIVLLALGSWIATVVIAVFSPDPRWRGEVLFALVFAPLGCLTRFYASLKLNPLVASFPMGTFAVNVFGSTVLAVAYVLQRVALPSSSSMLAAGAVGGGMAGCQVLQGVEDGFCGCLTTVSTWVAEIQGLRRRHGYLYGVASVAASLAMMVLVMGSVRWSVGWSEPVCITSRTTS